MAGTRHTWLLDACVHCRLRRKHLAARKSSVHGRQLAHYVYYVNGEWRAERPDCQTAQRSLFDAKPAIVDLSPPGPGAESKAGARVRVPRAWERVSGEDRLTIAGSLAASDGCGVDICVSADDRFFGTVRPWEVRITYGGHLLRRVEVTDTAFDAKEFALRVARSTFYFNGSVLEIRSLDSSDEPQDVWRTTL